ncbi:MAG TPA: TauD/TfdA family dioxygenase [Polyangiales bacterium]|nr:TauD/TfdA family dioxygenase [Polyangiales bacterium]
MTISLGETTRPVSTHTISTPALHARFTWQPGPVAIWDNRLVQHRAISDYGAERRVLYRVTSA